MAHRTLSDRFWSKVVQSGDCWIWTGAIDKRTGYGRVSVDKVSRYAHRVSYEMMLAEIPAGLHIDHLCRTRACVNPFHLDPVPTGVNQARSPLAHHAKNACPSGHPYSDGNLLVYTDKRGYAHRQCRTCHSAACKRWNDAQKVVA